MKVVSSSSPGLHIDSGIIATPGAGAQDVAGRLKQARVRTIFNFAPTPVTV